MKHTSLLIPLLLVSLGICSQTVVRLNVEYERVATQKGELYQYSGYYLAISDVQTANDTSFVLKSITLSTDSVKKHSSAPKTDRRSVRLPVPLNEDAITATNVAKKAESVAKQIYRIREARLNLLTGEAEHTPADEGSLRQMLAGLDKMEKELTALFTGSRKVSRYSKTVTYVPEQQEDITGVVIMRFSRFEGPVAADNLSGAPVFIDIKYIREEVPQTKKKKNEPAVTRITGAYVKIYNNERTLAEGRI